MTKRIDLLGLRYGSLAVVAAGANTPAGRATWECRCDCGRTLTVVGYSLRGGRTVSCGCRAVERAKLAGAANATHGRTDTPEFRAWTAMISRCTNARDYRFKRYGARGIKVCERWLASFEAFLADVGPKPFPRAQLDRERNNDGYEPGNCRWVTSKLNNNNRECCRYVEHDGRRLTLSQWSDETGINQATIRLRLESGWTVHDTLTKPVRRKSRAAAARRLGRGLRRV